MSRCDAIHQRCNLMPAFSRLPFEMLLDFNSLYAIQPGRERAHSVSENPHMNSFQADAVLHFRVLNILRLRCLSRTSWPPSRSVVGRSVFWPYRSSPSLGLFDDVEETFGLLSENAPTSGKAMKIPLGGISYFTKLRMQRFRRIDLLGCSVHPRGSPNPNRSSEPQALARFRN